MNRAWTYNQIAGTFWQDRKIRSLSPDGRTLALYLLTCPDRSAEGFFTLPAVMPANHLLWQKERLDGAWADIGRELGKDGEPFALYDSDAEVVLICKALKYHPPKGIKSIRGALKVLDGVHDAPVLFDRFVAAADRYAPEFASAIRERYMMGAV